MTKVYILIALLIIALVLVQQSKSGGGLGTTFGGGGSDSLFGAHASSQLSRLTAIFASIFLIVTLSLAVLTAHRPKEQGLAGLSSMISNIVNKQQPVNHVTPITNKPMVLPMPIQKHVPATSVPTKTK